MNQTPSAPAGPGGRQIDPEALATVRRLSVELPLTPGETPLESAHAWAGTNGYRTAMARTLTEWDQLHADGAIFVDEEGHWELGCPRERGESTFVDDQGVVTWIPRGETAAGYGRPALVIYPTRKEQAA